MSSSWGHVVAPVVEADVQREESMPYPWRHRCRTKRHCKGRTAYIIAYQYVTGRHGRTSCREVTACAEHAAEFAEKHGLAWPPEVPPLALYGQRIDVAILRGVRKDLA